MLMYARHLQHMHLLPWVVITREDVHVLGAGGMKEICVPSSQFCFEPKTALETKILKKKKEKKQGSEKVER